MGKGGRGQFIVLGESEALSGAPASRYRACAAGQTADLPVSTMARQSKVAGRGWP